MEQDFLRWLKQEFGDANDEVVVGIGDDGAVLKSSDCDLVVVTDTIAEGTHFKLPADVSDLHAMLQLVGRKSLAVNLSDIAAMGAQAHSATLNFQCPRSFDLETIRHLYLGCAQIAKQFGVTIIGGDTNSWNGPLVVSATVFGGRAKDQTGWLLTDAQPDDAILVSGEFGGSIHGRHLSFDPRLKLARYLVSNFPVHAATDASDSLTADLMAIATASNVQMQLDMAAIPISNDVKATDPKQRIAAACHDGEDFELIVTVDQATAKRILADTALPARMTQIGTVVQGQPQLIDTNGTLVPAKGYEH
jgi:thiamine-monophosphate kinase